MPGTRYFLSPYSVLHPSADGQGAVLVHALYGSRFELSPSLLRMVADVLEGGLPAEREAGEARAALDTLIAEKVLVDRDELGRQGGLEAFRNRLDAVELAFHRGFNEGGYFPAGIDQAHPPIMRKEIRGAGVVPLDSHSLSEAGTGLVQCLTQRRSIRDYADRPLEKRRLEQFLQLTARAYAVLEVPGLGMVSLRNYPSGGARYPLEIYPLVTRVQGVEFGLYHYEPYHHRLIALDCPAAHREALITSVTAKMGPAHLRGVPAVLFLITAVFARTCWKYRGVPYHLILQEVGGLYQTMYLAATLLDLAPCAIGAFPELAVAEMLGVDSRDEAQVGLFLLGVPETPGRSPSAVHVTAVRLRDGSPFSADPGSRSVELVLEDGVKTIIDVDDLPLERRPDGRLVCPVMRGRSRAVFEADTEAALRVALASAGRGFTV